MEKTEENCPQCREEMEYIQKHKDWYCYNCKKYLSAMVGESEKESREEKIEEEKPEKPEDLAEKKLRKLKKLEEEELITEEQYENKAGEILDEYY